MEIAIGGFILVFFLSFCLVGLFYILKIFFHLAGIALTIAFNLCLWGFLIYCATYIGAIGSAIIIGTIIAVCFGIIKLVKIMETPSKKDLEEIENRYKNVDN